MKILFDQGTPAPLRRALVTHDVETAYERGWQALTNGDLLRSAEAAGFDALITTDQNLRYQLNLTGRGIAIIILPTTNWKLIQSNAGLVVDAVDALSAGAYVELQFPA